MSWPRIGRTSESRKNGPDQAPAVFKTLPV